jgi:hypothetical protein
MMAAARAYPFVTKVTPGGFAPKYGLIASRFDVSLAGHSFIKVVVGGLKNPEHATVRTCCSSSRFASVTSDANQSVEQLEIRQA